MCSSSGEMTTPFDDSDYKLIKYINNRNQLINLLTLINKVIISSKVYLSLQ